MYVPAHTCSWQCTLHYVKVHEFTVQVLVGHCSDLRLPLNAGRAPEPLLRQHCVHEEAAIAGGEAVPGHQVRQPHAADRPALRDAIREFSRSGSTCGEEYRDQHVMLGNLSITILRENLASIFKFGKLLVKNG